MNISELNHLENVNDASLVNGGYVSVGSSAGASASGFLPSAYTYSDVYTNNYGGYYYYGEEYGSASSSAGASALSGSASAGSSASGYADSGYYYYY
jgi:hypothetical protein